MLQSADIEVALRGVIETGTGVIALGLAGLLAIAYLAALLDRAERAPRAARILRSVAPPTARRAAALLLAGQAALTATLASPPAVRPAHAASAVAAPGGTEGGSVRSWLQGEEGPVGGSGHTPPAAPATPTGSGVGAPPPGLPAERGAGRADRSGLTYSPAPGSVGRAATEGTAVEPTLPAQRYEVRSGDSLWRIAARRLEQGASNRDIDAAWRRIYEANRAAVGSDPGLIHPGLVLDLPALR